MGKKLSVFLQKERIFQKILKKKLSLFLYWTNDFIERSILKNEQFYWTIIQWENERNRWKINDIFRTNEINFSTKSTNEMVRSQTKWKKPISA